MMLLAEFYCIQLVGKQTGIRENFAQHLLLEWKCEMFKNTQQQVKLWFWSRINRVCVHTSSWTLFCRNVKHLSTSVFGPLNVTISLFLPWSGKIMFTSVNLSRTCLMPSPFAPINILWKRCSIMISLDFSFIWNRWYNDNKTEQKLHHIMLLGKLHTCSWGNRQKWFPFVAHWRQLP